MYISMTKCRPYHMIILHHVFTTTWAFHSNETRMQISRETKQILIYIIIVLRYNAMNNAQVYILNAL